MFSLGYLCIQGTRHIMLLSLLSGLEAGQAKARKQGAGNKSSARLHGTAKEGNKEYEGDECSASVQAVTLLSEEALSLGSIFSLVIQSLDYLIILISATPLSLGCLLSAQFSQSQPTVSRDFFAFYH